MRVGEVSGGEATEAGGLAAADAVLDAGVRPVAYFQLLQRALAVGGVGEEDLVAHAFGDQRCVDV
ncbi:hypothetical protein [Streptomyces sp. NPDC052701]|uniref:hypothetical protein n=1 Tax=Streptomyces sp. NPDC052701 TaxID=3155533 RepID=UPI00341CDEDD